MKKSINVLLFLLAVSFPVFAEKVSLYVGQGSAWQKRAPQVAVWIESEGGEYVQTLFVTRSASGKKWKFGPKGGRPESVPAWYFAKGQNPGVKPGKDALDATTSATPKKGIAVDADVDLIIGKKYKVRAEFNQSFDYNERWTKENSSVNGQPSVIYEAFFVPSGAHEEFELAFSGTGSLDGSDGEVHVDENEFLTTAREIAGKIYFTLN